MNRSLSILAALLVVAVAGCASPPAEEEEMAMSDAALERIADQPAEVPAGAAPKVETIDLSKIAYDISDLKDSTGALDYSKFEVDVLDTGRYDRWDERDRKFAPKWVESDRRDVPDFVEKFGSADVGGGKCRIKSLSLKKIVVGCKWTW